MKPNIARRIAALKAMLPQPIEPTMRPEVAAAGLGAIEVLYSTCGDIKLAKRAMVRWMTSVNDRLEAGDKTCVIQFTVGDRPYVRGVYHVDWDTPTEEGLALAKSLLRECGWDGVQRPCKSFVRT
jgi:hypothetical protein